jgi:hypothetical protein
MYWNLHVICDTTECGKESSDWLLEVGDRKRGANITERQSNAVTNEDSLELNKKSVDLMPGKETVYRSVDTVPNQVSHGHLEYPEEVHSGL